MPARVLVFCTKPITGVTAKSLTKELRVADLMTLAECLELPGGEEAAVDAMWEVLKITGSRSAFEIHWHASQRPVQLSLGPPLAGELVETLENFPASRAAGPKRVRAHVAATVAIASFEMGITGSNDLAATICEVLAFHLAERADGLVWFYHREFAAPDDRGATLWKTGT